MLTVRLDVEKHFAVLERIKDHSEACSDLESFKRATLALSFVWMDGRVHNFEDHLTCFSHNRALNASAVFETQKEAQDWLRQPLDDRQTTCVAVTGQHYSVHYSLEHGDKTLIRVPTQAELIAPHWSTGSGMDETVAALHRARQRVTESEDLEIIQVALLALHYIVESGQARDFERYLEDFDTPASHPPLRSFETRAEAEAWVKAHPRPPSGGRVEIGGQRFMVGYDREVNLRVLVRELGLEARGLSEGSDKDD